MKYETLFITVRVAVMSTHANIADIVSEVEKYSLVSMSDTGNVNILQTEILLSRVRNSNVKKYPSYETAPLISNRSGNGN